MKNPQAQQILNHLQQGAKITPIDALNQFGCFRLAARIHDLKKKGWNIKTETELKNGKEYAAYSLINE